MTETGQGNAEFVHKALSDDLRFADAKAAFIAVSIGGWVTAINNAVVFQQRVGEPVRPKLVGWLLLAMVIADTIGLLLSLLAIWPKIVSHKVNRVHLAKGLKKFNLPHNGKSREMLLLELEATFDKTDQVV